MRLSDGKGVVYNKYGHPAENFGLTPTISQVQENDIFSRKGMGRKVGNELSSSASSRL